MVGYTATHRNEKNAINIVKKSILMDIEDTWILCEIYRLKNTLVFIDWQRPGTIMVLYTSQKLIVFGNNETRRMGSQFLN